MAPAPSFSSQLKTLISEALTSLDAPLPSEIHLEHPTDPQHGEWSTNVAMVAFRDQVSGVRDQDAQRSDRITTTLSTNQPTTPNKHFASPRALADGIVAQLEILLPTSSLQFHISKIEVAGLGFINFQMTDAFYMAEMGKLLVAQAKMSSQKNEGKRVITEFTDPNPFKEFHIGHLYSNSVGETISRLQEATGAIVRRVCYQGDVGMHVAKSVWGMQQLMKSEAIDMASLEKVFLPARVKFLGKAYSLGATQYEEDETAKEEMKEINKAIFVYTQADGSFSKPKSELERLYVVGRAWSLEYFESIYQRLGTHFEGYYFESQVGQVGTKIVQEFLKKGVFQESEGAVIFPGSQYGLHDRVFLNSLGLPTYEAKELGLAPCKYQDWPYDRSIIITGNEINEYFKVLLKAMSVTHPDLAAKTVHLSHGMVRLPEGKMSSRTGKILTGEWLLDEAKAKLLEVLAENKSDLAVETRQAIAEVLAVASVKYALLKNSVGGDIKFDFSESVSFDGNSGPYLQYTYARAKSVLRKAEAAGIGVSGTELQKSVPQISNLTDKNSAPHDYEFNAEELAVLRQLSRFGETITRAADEYSPHHLCTYLFDLAQEFNSFYAKHSILGTEESEALEVRVSVQYRVLLTQAVAMTIQEGLQLLGIQTVEEM